MKMMHVKQWLFGGDRSGGAATQLGLLVLRVFSGLSMALAHGLGKLENPERIINGLTEDGFLLPVLFGWAAIIAEFFGGILLALGISTRWMAGLILITMLVAAFWSHGGDPFGRQEKALLFAAISLLFVLKGGGKWSLDAVILR